MIDEKSFLLCLIKKFPEFERYWAKDDNYNSMSDGSGSYSGICAEFSQFFIEIFDDIDDLKLRALFKDIEAILQIINSDNSKKELAASISSCFIENISRTKPGELSKDLMGEFTRNVFDQWHI